MPIVIFGAGGHGRETAVLIEAINAAGPRFELIGFLDDDSTRHGTTCGELPVLGGSSFLIGRDDVAIALGVGRPRAKQALVHRLMNVRGVAPSRMPSLVHPSVRLHRRVRLGDGVQLHEGTILTTDIVIGSYVTCNRRVDVSHDCRIGNYATLAPAVVLTGAATVGAGADVGAHATCLPGVQIGEWASVGAGAVVTRDVSDGWTVAGVPARPLRDAHGDVVPPATWLRAV